MDDISKRCEACQNWQAITNGAKINDWGECVIAESTNPTKAPPEFKSLAVAINSEDDNGGAWLWTHKNYGCVQFVEASYA